MEQQRPGTVAGAERLARRTRQCPPLLLLQPNATAAADHLPPIQLGPTLQDSTADRVPILCQRSVVACGPGGLPTLGRMDALAPTLKPIIENRCVHGVQR